MDVFFIKYRKMLLFGSYFMFLYFLYEVYKGIEMINSGKAGEGSGTLVDACISLAVSVYFFTNVRKANKAFKEENAAREADSNISPVE